MSRRSLLAASAAATLAAALVGSGVTVAQAHSRVRPQPLPAPAGQRLVATFAVTRGAQVYECLPNADGSAGGSWKARPVAVLQDPGHGHALRGTHDSAAPQGSPSVPQWTLLDGSRVTAKVQSNGTFPAPDPTAAIAALRLDVVQNSGAGLLADVDVVQRDLTRGGVGPSGGCDPASAATVSSPYQARYTFWALAG